MTEELKGCPWCGTNPKIGSALIEKGYRHDYYWVYCADDNCTILPDTGLDDTAEEAIKKWNTRHESR